jgi:ATP-dependent Clp protease protease subunit
MDLMTMRQRPAEREPQNTLRAYPPLAVGRPAGFHGAGGWEIMLCGDLTDKQLDLTERLMDVPRRSSGTIFFDSCGGNVFVGLSLASLIRLRGLDATAVVAGECSSAALLPFAACRRRFVTPHSTLLFHPLRWQSEEEVKLEEAAEWARHFQHLESDLDQLLARLFELPLETIRAWTRPGRFLTGSDIAAAGIARLVNLFEGDVWSQIGATRSS